MKQTMAICITLLATAIVGGLMFRFLADWPVPESYIAGTCTAMLGACIVILGCIAEKNHEL